MNHEELFEKYLALVAENRSLKEENEILKAKLGIPEKQHVDPCPDFQSHSPPELATPETNLHSVFTTYADPMGKIKLFRSLFRGRDDVYAKRWDNRDGKFGYKPVCLNEWKSGSCRKPAGKCFQCPHQLYDRLNEKIVEAHLRGNIVIGIYPLYQDETCHFLAIDFDDDGWQKDTSTLREVCLSFGIPVAVERSRSGNGAHAWFFFENKIPASLARKFGTALLTSSMNRRHEIPFRSYDRFFPNQDTMPKGGFGSLIALPLQKKARDQGNSVFVDEEFKSYTDQWKFLSQLKKLTEDGITALISRLCGGNELGFLKEEDETDKPWEMEQIKLSKRDFPEKIDVIKANMLFISKASISQRALNRLKRLAVFQNPEFYKAQAMRMPTYNKSRVICCADETPEYLCLPRGCEKDILSLLHDLGIETTLLNKANPGRNIRVEFNGKLREEQLCAAEELLKHENGVLSASTAFGKTVIASKLIGDRKVNTLILVHRQQLLSQWADKLAEFLNINEKLPALENKRGRKKQQSLIGQIGAGKNNTSGIVDIAIMQSLVSSGEVKEIIRNYGMVIIDECHHVPAFSFEQVLKSTSARYVYGLTATPTRQDGHHPILFMHCGPIRYRVDDKVQADKRPFEHYIIPKFTHFRVPFETAEKVYTIQELYSEIIADEFRNELIVGDVVKNYQEGRNSLVLTERTAHVALLAQKIKDHIPDAITLIGGTAVKAKKKALLNISEAPTDKPLTLIATGKYIGEGFDEPRLDTLFLAMPISWKGTLKQYAGRLHRLFGGKLEVRIYDYVDIQVRMLEKMYNKRLSGYASIGYRAKAEDFANESTDIIFDNRNFLPVYQNDVMKVVREIIIVSPFITKRRMLQMLQIIKAALERKVEVTIVTRPASDFTEEPVLEETLNLLQTAGLNLVYKSKIHQKFAVLDRKIIWYGSINLLSFGRSEESIMRLESSNIANELIRSMEELTAARRPQIDGFLENY